jgi:hypothetical protein
MLSVKHKSAQELTAAMTRELKMDMAALEDEAEHMVATIGEQSCDITALTSQILRLTTELERTERERQDLRAAKSECVCVLYCVVLCARARRLPAPLSSFSFFSLS